MAREPSRRFITNVVNFASKPWNVAGREVQELIRKILESDQEGRPALHRLLDPISHQDTERDDPTDGAVIRGDGTNWKVADAVTVFDVAHASTVLPTSPGFLNVTGTLAPTADQGTTITITADTSNTTAYPGRLTGVVGGITGSYAGDAGTTGVYGYNGTQSTAGAGLNPYAGHGAFKGKSGVFGLAYGVSTGTNIGVAGYSQNSTGHAIGGFFSAPFWIGNGSAHPEWMAIGLMSIGGQVGVNTSIGLAVGMIQSGSMTFENSVILGDSCHAVLKTNGGALLILKDVGSTAFAVDGGGALRVKAVTGFTTAALTYDHHTVGVTAAGGVQTITLPAIATATRGRWYRIKKTDVSVNTVIIAASGADTVDGAATQTLTGQYESVDVVCPATGTDWLTFGASAGIGAGIISGSGTLNTVPKWTPDGTTLGNSTITDDGTTVTANTATTMRAVALSDGTAGFLNVTGTLPGSGTFGFGSRIVITSSNGSSGAQRAFLAQLSAGNTSAVGTYGALINNFAAGTATGASGVFSNANYGTFTGATAAGTNNAGIVANATNATEDNYAVIGFAGAGARAVGGYFVGTTGTAVAGVVGALATNVSIVSTAALFDNSSVVAPIAIFRDNGTPVLTVGDSTTVTGETTVFGHAASDGTAGFLNVTGTLPAVISAQVIAANALITSAGSSAFSQIALAGSLLAGYTGTSKTNAVSAFNTAAGTGTTTSGGIANYGVYSTTEAVGAGWNVGVGGYASNSTVRNVGGYFQASNSAATDAIGVHGRAQTATNNVGVLASTGSGIPSISGIYTAFLADNTDAAQPIAIFRDNGVETVSIEDAAAVSSTRGFLNVTGTLPTTGFPGGAFFNITTAGTANSQNGIEVLLKPGFTGSGKTMAGYFENTVLGTSTNIGNANVSLYANTIGVGAGFGTGISSQSSGSTTYNTGSYNQGGTGTGTTGLGGYFVGAGGTNSIGLFAMIGAGAQIQPATSAVAILDNAAVAAPIALFRDNGSTVFSIQDGGGITVKTAAVGSTTLDNGNHVITADATAGAVTYTLPAISATTRGIWYRIKKIDATANTVTIARTGADTIDGAASQVITLQYQSIDIICPSAGTDWLTLGASSGLSAGSGTDDEARAMAFMAL